MKLGFIIISQKAKDGRCNEKPKNKISKLQPFPGKVIATVFWDYQGVILVNSMAKGTTINSDAYIVTLNKLKNRI